MISIRTGLVVAAFVATGLTAVAENIAERLGTEAAPQVSVGLDEAMPAKGLRLARKVLVPQQALDLSPWI